MAEKVAEVFFDEGFLARVAGLVRDTQGEILVACYEWKWYEGQRAGTIQDLNREVAKAARRGVVVKVVLHNESKGRTLGSINRRTAGKLERHGVKVRMGSTARVIHGKVWVFDRKVVVIGSHNVSGHSVNRNAEAGVMVRDLEEVAKAVRWFDGLWDRGIG